MMLPSRMVFGASSLMASSMSARISESSEIFKFNSFSIGTSKALSFSFIEGIAAKVFAIAMRSRPFAMPYAIRPKRRSISRTERRLSAISSLVMGSFTNASTESSLAFISETSISGFSSQLRSMRLPIEVFVLSIAQRREPRFSLLRIVSHISRLRRAV